MVVFVFGKSEERNSLCRPRRIFVNTIRMELEEFSCVAVAQNKEMWLTF